MGYKVLDSLAISAIEHIFGFLEREFHCLMFYKFVDIMSRTGGN